MGLVLLIIVLVLLFGGLPHWGYHSYGYGPSGLAAVGRWPSRLDVGSAPRRRFYCRGGPQSRHWTSSRPRGLTLSSSTASVASLWMGVST